MKTKTKIKKQVRKKTNTEVVETILGASKNKKWFEVAQILSGPKRRRLSINLSDIDKMVKDGENIVIPGKVLSQGVLNKKTKIIALDFSENAKDKLNKTKKEFITISDEIKKNPEAKNIRIINTTK